MFGADGISEQLKTEIEEIAFSSDVDLRQYATQVDDEVASLEERLIERYIAVGPEVANLHNQISSCDAILQRMEAILANFHNDLGTISSEIQDLQLKSTLMNKRLQNRQAVRGHLSQFLSDMAIPEQLIKHMLFTPVTEQEFLENLHELDHKINFSLEQSMVDYRSFEDVNVLLKKLKIKAVSKIREYLLQKIYSLRKPLTNYQIPQNQMLKYRFYNEFLLAHDRETAIEIRNEYVTTMSKVYYSYFKAYCTKLNKLQLDTTAEKDLLLGKRLDEQNPASGVGSSVLGSMTFSSTSTLTTMNATGHAPTTSNTRLGLFGLGERATRVLSRTELEAPIILPHVAAMAEVKYPAEVLFRSVHFALLDAVCREYFFLSDFFLLSTGTVRSSATADSTHRRTEHGGALTALFDQVLGRTFSLLHKQIESHLIPSMSHDALGMLLCLQLLHALLRVAHHRNVPVLDKFWTSITETFWVHVTDRLDAHIASLQSDFDVNAFAGSARALSANPGGSLSGANLPARIYSLLRPHPVARRYAELAASLHSIGHSYPGTPLLSNSSSPSTKQPSDGRVGSSSELPHSHSDTTFANSSKRPDTEQSTRSASSTPHELDPPSIDARILSRLAQLHTHLEQVLVRLSDFLPKQRLKWVFLINNYDLIISVLTERGAGNAPEVNRCREAAAKYTAAFINEALTPYFGSLIAFVHDFQANPPASPPASGIDQMEPSSAVRNDEARVTRIIKGFNIDWKNSIEKIHGEIMVEFANFTLGTEVFQALLAELVQHYHRFQKVMSQSPFKNMPIRNQLINIHHIMNEIKKCKPTF
ncbi:hypothetical protein CRM22_011162 [Opisthorchis felineus]|uniref:Vacuolar protein sorting-associated protein 52 homolog n=1 Tax=Opisthorchis felineus TaxID=147828 RepID=A0A4V3S9N7_OPIFE|nr:hypothetical protein CRM22_011162 [Opisthorchis felineus]